MYIFMEGVKLPKRIICLILVIMMLVPLSGCSDKTADKLFKYDITSDPSNLDPQLALDYASQLVIENTMEGLLRVNEEGKLTEGVAIDYTVSKDGLRYEFNLRQDAKWENGESVTANDFVFGFKRLFYYQTESQTAANFYCIKNSKAIHEQRDYVKNIGVKADGNYKLIIELEYKNSMLPQLLTTAGAMPCNEKFFNETKGKYGLEADKVLSNGPFYLKSWAHDDYLALRKNKEYKSAKPAIASGVSFIIEADKKKSQDRFLKKQSDALIFSNSEYDKLKDKGYNIDSFQNTTWGILFNIKNQYFKNEDLRRALLTCFDRSSYTKVVPEYFVPAQSIVPPSITMLDASYREYAGQNVMPEYNVKKAKEYFNQAKSKLSINTLSDTKIIIPNDLPHVDMFSYISQKWQKELGVFLAVESLEPEEYQKRIEQKDFDCAIAPISADFNSPESVLSQFSASSRNNYFGYKSTTLDGILSQASQKESLEKTAQSYKQAEETIINDAVFIPMYFQTEYFTTSLSTNGMQYQPSNKIIHFAYARKKD
ncbi:MAG: peptide transporter substrate-binding protein [Oscillospiraceae bacterium]|nr:peptide transporter substrate-binding protein [Oscillospiraceae bacterium]